MIGEGGLLLVDKPVGPTSHDVVQSVRRALGERRVGHAGTLDPPASGLLPIVIGRATRLARFLPDGPKCYVGTLRLGLTSLTDDAASETSPIGTGPLPGAAEVSREAGCLEGEQMQVPPSISARHVEGRRLYRVNRRGARVEGPARPVTVSRFHVEETGNPDVYRFDAVVSTGTYIRSLVRDLGARLGCGAILVELRRTAIGPLRVESAVPPPKGAASLPFPDTAFFPVDRMPLSPPELRLGLPDEVLCFVRGQTVESADDRPDGLRVVSSGDGIRLGIGVIAAGRLQPRVVLVSAAEPKGT